MKEAGGKAPLPALTENAFLLRLATEHFREQMSAGQFASLPRYLPQSEQLAFRQLRRQCQDAVLEPGPAAAILATERPAMEMDGELPASLAEAQLAEMLQAGVAVVVASSVVAVAPLLLRRTRGRA